MIARIKSKILNPHPLRYTAIGIMRLLGLLKYEQLLRYNVVERPHYGYCAYNSARLAYQLGYKRMSIIEFGVAGGNGILNLEYHVEEIMKTIPIEIEIYGFDSGSGLTPALDYRDMPYYFKQGFYSIDLEKLNSRIKKAKLILGDVKHTLSNFLDYDPAPIGAIIFDLDLYSSTVAALKLLDMDDKYFLPRLHCFFDDTTGNELQHYCDYTGERLAINEFNSAHEYKKFSSAYNLLAHEIKQTWHHRVWILHNFKHSRYCDFIAEENQQNHIKGK